MAGMQEKYDTAFLGILQNEGKIEGFLDAVYGFLFRKTDYFLTLKQDGPRSLGFAPGVAEKITLKAFKKYHNAARQIEEHRMKKSDEEKAKATSNQDEKNSLSSGDPNSGNTPEVPVAVNEVEVEEAKDDQKDSSDKKEEKEDETKEEKKPTSDAANDTENTKQNEEDDNPELTKLQKAYQDNPDSYNGAIRDNYSWSQTIMDVDVKINIPKYVKGKDVKVDVEKKHIKASYRDEEGKMVDVVDEDLTWDIQKNESMWSVSPGEFIHINLEKIQERWWEALLENEPHISVRKIDPSRPMTDLDEEAQAKIGEMMFNQRQKQLGLPGSEEIKMEKVLKDAWDAEGSPFKGQPYDPSKLNLQPSGQMGF